MINIFNHDKMFITSDLHMFHKNILAYCERPYNNIEEMNSDIIRKFQNLPDNSVVWNLGDVFFGKEINKHSLELMKNTVSQMKGNKTFCLVLGNHDKNVAKLFKKNGTDLYKEIGFDFVYNCPIFFNKEIIFSHEPFDVGNFKLFYGHIHDKTIEEFSGKNYKNVCFDANNFEILDLKKLSKYFSSL